MKLTDNTILITGGSSGIGLIVTGRDAASLEAVRERVRGRRTIQRGVIAALIGLATSLSGCSTPLIGIDPALSPAQRDQVQREARRPPVEPNANYETVTVQSDIPMSFNSFSDWFRARGAPEFALFMTATSAIHGAVRSDPLIGSWREVGDRRRIVFADGNSAIEEIVVDQRPQRFQYEMWNLTNDTGRYVT